MRWPHRARIAGSVLIPLTVAIASAAEPPTPATRAVVALARLELPETLGISEGRGASIESAIADALRDGGLEAIAADEFDTAWRRRLQEAGGYFDVVSGRPDLAKRRALRAATLRELHERDGARVVLQPALVVVAAEYSRGKAAWDGARETAAPTGSGEVPALSLVMRVEDLTGREIASSRAGIQLVAKYSTWNRKYGPVPPDKLLADEARWREAVGRALAAVLDALRAPPAAVEAAEGGVAETTVEAGTAEIEPPPEGARVAALRAVLFPDEEITVPPDVRTRYLKYLRARLEEAGWWLLAAQAFDTTLREVALERGGIYDPLTGKGDADKRTAAIAEARRRVTERYGASVFVTAGIFLRSARFAGEKATWDGVSEKVADIATWKKLLVSTRGTTHALSFGVLVEDGDGTPRHTGWGGIQLVDRLERGRFVPVSPELLFADPARDRNAVDLALAGWLTGQDARPDGERP